MAADASAYVRALVLWAKMSPTGLADLRAEFFRLFQEQQSAGGKALVSTTINGKQASWMVAMNTEDKFSAVGEALRILTSSNNKKTLAQIV
jgi:hypothetical protein